LKKRRIGVGFFEADEETKELVNSVLDSGRISYGPLCRQLEEEFAEMHGKKYAVLSASGTDSLRAALHAAKILHEWKDGDEVIVPATTFVATINIVLQNNLTPVLVDVDPHTYCIDVEKVEQAVTYKTRAIIPVNLLGQSADLSNIETLADNKNLAVIEDSCEAMHVTHWGNPVGSWGDIGCYSFYMAHLVTAGVGGIAITDDPWYRDVMRSLVNHGRDTIYTSIDDDAGLEGDAMAAVMSRRFSFWFPGYSSRMTELQAALALVQLRRLGPMVARRQAVAAGLTRGLDAHRSMLQLPETAAGNVHSWMMYGIVTKSTNKWPLVTFLENRGIETRDLLPIVNQPAYKDWINPGDFPVSDKLVRSGFYIGCHQGMSEEDVDYIISTVDEFYGR
jgi:dTDP-4-amino-4,6-dideoxygalactose transaminase